MLGCDTRFCTTVHSILRRVLVVGPAAPPPKPTKDRSLPCCRRRYGGASASGHVRTQRSVKRCITPSMLLWIVSTPKHMLYLQENVYSLTEFIGIHMEFPMPQLKPATLLRFLLIVLAI